MVSEEHGDTDGTSGEEFVSGHYLVSVVADFDVCLLHQALPLFGMVMSFLLMWLSSFASFVSAVSAGVLVVSWLSSLSAFTSLFHLVRGIAGFTISVLVLLLVVVVLVY